MYVERSCSSPIGRAGINYKDKIEVPVITLDDYIEEH